MAKISIAIHEALLFSIESMAEAYKKRRTEIIRAALQEYLEIPTITPSEQIVSESPKNQKVRKYASRISLEIPDETLSQLLSRATEEAVSRGELIRRALQRRVDTERALISEKVCVMLKHWTVDGLEYERSLRD